jgi:subtilisin family serine protease
MARATAGTRFCASDGRSVRVAHALASLAAAALVAAWASAQLAEPAAQPARHVPNDPLFGRQWPLDNFGQGGGVIDADVDAPEAWAITRGSPDIVIAVLDDAVQLDHPDLAANLAGAGRDFRVEPPLATAKPRFAADRHGTAVAGVAVARGDNALGVTGICPLCRLLPIAVDGTASFGTAAALRYAIASGADVINISWGYSRARRSATDDAIRAALEAAATHGRNGRGTLVVVSAANEPVDNCSGPTLDLAALDSVLAVSVADHHDEIGGAGYGPCLDLLAPAKPRQATTIGVMTTDRTGIDGNTGGDYHETFGGTSAAAPLVTGIAGLLLSLNPQLTRVELQRLLEHTADKVDPMRAAYDSRGFSERAGFGRVNAARSLVPNVTISVMPGTVGVGEPFAITVTASAPFGLDSVWWFTVGIPAPRNDALQRRLLAGQIVDSVTFSGVTMATPGTFVLGADARDRRYATPLQGYPHTASQAGRPATATLSVIERD